MALEYEVTFTINGIGSLTVGENLNQLNVRSGSDGYDLATPSTLNASFIIDENDQSAPFWLGRQIKVEVKPLGQTKFSVFFGYVTQVTVEPVNPTGDIAIVNISAASQLMNLQNVTVGGSGYSAQNEYFRAIEVGNEIRYIQWQDIPVGMTWADIDPTLTWPNFDTQFARQLLNGGIASGFDLEAYSGGATDALTFLRNWATGTNAWLYDSVDTYTTNIVFYNVWSAASATNLDVSTCAIWDSMGVQSELSQIYTSVTFSNSTTSASFTNFNNLALYGDRATGVSSQCSNSLDLDTLATSRGTALSAPNMSLNSLTIDLDLVSYANQKKLMRFEGATFWNLQNVPAIFGGEQIYFQAGINLDLNCYHAEVSLNLVPDSIRRGLTTWGSIPYSYTWANWLTPTTTWADIR